MVNDQWLISLGAWAISLDWQLKQINIFIIEYCQSFNSY